MSVPSAGSWLDILLRQTAGSRSSARPLQASLNLSTTLPQTTPPTENLQSEISSVVVADGQRFTRPVGAPELRPGARNGFSRPGALDVPVGGYVRQPGGRGAVAF